MCKSILYAANTSPQSVAVGASIDFGTIVRKDGCNITLLKDSVMVQGAGNYDIDTNITFTAGGGGTAVVTLYKDGTTIPGATTSMNVANTLTYSLAIPAVVHQSCGMESTIKAVVSGVPVTVQNAAIVAKKV